MTAPTPMSDERLAEIEALTQQTDTRFVISAETLELAQSVPELLAEVRRQRRGGKTLGEIMDKQLTDIVNLTESHDIIGEDGDGDWMLVWERLHQIKADRDASNARVDELEQEAQQHVSIEQSYITRLNEHIGLKQEAAADRDRARSIAVALEGQVAAVRELSAGLIHGGGCGLETGDPCDCGHQAVLRALDGGA